MHHYCAIVVKNSEAEPQPPDRLKRFVSERLTFEPEELVLHKLEPRTYVFSASAAQRRDQVASLLKSTDVFPNVSTYQAFGRTALEVMVCGATAIAPRIGGAAQFICDGENGLLVDTLDPEPVSAALSRLCEDHELRNRLQAAAAEEASSHSILRAALSEYTLFARR